MQGQRKCLWIATAPRQQIGGNTGRKAAALHGPICRRGRLAMTNDSTGSGISFIAGEQRKVQMGDPNDAGG